MNYSKSFHFGPIPLSKATQQLTVNILSFRVRSTEESAFRNDL